ncbi:MAG: DNA cytosine methyltransferase [Pseudomonadota bacterium]
MRITRPQSTKKVALKCADVFAGAGGLAEGFRQNGWRIVAANDADQAASETFRLNFPEAAFFEGSAINLKAGEVLKTCDLAIGELDVLIGGPPCQSFSYNNHHRSADDERARLFESYLQLVSDLRPKCLVMENVPGILTIGDGTVISEIRETLESLQYDCEVVTLSAEEFGTPQVRKRVFVLASRLGSAKELIPIATHRSAKARLGEKPRRKRAITVQNAIGDLPEIENGGGAEVSSYKGKRPNSNYQKEMRKGSRKLYNHVCHRLTEVNMNRMVHVPEGGNWRDIPFELLTAGMKRAKLTDHTKRYGRLHRKGLASTLLTKCDPHWGAYVHPTQDRTITVREAARLQGFPDTFRFSGSKLGPQYEQVGNAVPVPVAKSIAEAMALHLASNNEDYFLDAAE